MRLGRNHPLGLPKTFPPAGAAPDTELWSRPDMIPAYTVWSCVADTGTRVGDEPRRQKCFIEVYYRHRTLGQARFDAHHGQVPPRAPTRALRWGKVSGRLGRRRITDRPHEADTVDIGNRFHMHVTSGSSTRSRPPRRRKPSAGAQARTAHPHRQGFVGAIRRSGGPIESPFGPRFQLGTVRGQCQCEFVWSLLSASVRAWLQRRSPQLREKLGRRSVRGGGMHAGRAGDARGTLGGVLDGPYCLGCVTTDPSSALWTMTVLGLRSGLNVKILVFNRSYCCSCSYGKLL